MDRQRLRCGLKGGGGKGERGRREGERGRREVKQKGSRREEASSWRHANLE